MSIKLIDEVKHVHPDKLVASITTIAIAITKDKSEDDVAVLAMIFKLLSDTIKLIAIQKAVVERTYNKE